MSKKHMFVAVAEKAAAWSGSASAFIIAASIIVVWGLTGPLFHYSDIWQLVINTSTTVITFLMVFLIQNSQNRDVKAVHIKLDELIRATEGAHTVLLDLERLTDQELSTIRKKYTLIAEESRVLLRAGGSDIHSPNVTTTKLSGISV